MTTGNRARRGALEAWDPSTSPLGVTTPLRHGEWYRASDGKFYCWPSPTPYDEPPRGGDLARPAPPARDTRPVRQILLAAAGVTLVIGSLMPWVDAQAVFVHVSRNGMDGDGKITAALGAALVILAAVEWAGNPPRSSLLRTLPILGGLLALAVAVLAYGDVSDRIADVQGEGIIATHGAGLYVVAIGAALALAAGSVGRRQQRDNAPDSGPAAHAHG